MALTWNWDKKAGSITLEQNGKEFELTLYQGNAFAIILSEQDETYTMYSFFLDKVHMKRCMGVDKKYKSSYGNNPYNRPGDRWTKVKIIKKNFPSYKEFIAVLIEAFDEITIEIA